MLATPEPVATQAVQPQPTAIVFNPERSASAILSRQTTSARPTQPTQSTQPASSQNRQSALLQVILKQPILAAVLPVALILMGPTIVWAILMRRGRV
jgi:hypothetical protein